MKKLILFTVMIFCFFAAFAQKGQDVEMGDVMRGEGRAANGRCIQTRG